MNYYKTAIEINEKVQDDYEMMERLVIEIVKNNPGAVVNAAKKVPGLCKKSKEELLDDRLLYVARGNKIQAIKECRMATGKSLPDAKAYVEMMMERQQ